ncbi:MAG: CDP-glycerol glycerophosphotransferase family protein, partial [Helicobacter sp.]|nr:CDP-glycerol glycerophosphotransferase family protein [Helicobacter sp.]
WVLNIFVLCFSVFKKRGILLVFSNTTNAYSNLLCLKNELERRGVAYRICSNDKSLTTLFLLLQSKIICIDQSNFFLSSMRLTAQSIVIQLWHGGGLYKKVAFDLCQTSQDFKRAKRIHQNTSFVNISDSKLNADYAKMFNVNQNQILSFGLPRTDLFYQIDEIKNKQEFLQKYPLLKGKKIYLYAPTFREKYKKRNAEILLDIQSINANFDDRVVIVRSHPSLEFKNKDFIDVSLEPLEWILSVSDGLISDYSSIIFDFAFFHRQILLYVPDLLDYVSTNRPLYRTPEELVGRDNVCYNQEELILAMQRGGIHRIWEEYMGSCRGDATARVVDFMLELH